LFRKSIKPDDKRFLPVTLPPKTIPSAPALVPATVLAVVVDLPLSHSCQCRGRGRCPRYCSNSHRGDLPCNRYRRDSPCPCRVSYIFPAVSNPAISAHIATPALGAFNTIVPTAANVNSMITNSAPTVSTITSFLIPIPLPITSVSWLVPIMTVSKSLLPLPLSMSESRSGNDGIEGMIEIEVKAEPGGYQQRSS